MMVEIKIIVAKLEVYFIGSPTCRESSVYLLYLSHANQATRGRQKLQAATSHVQQKLLRTEADLVALFQCKQFCQLALFDLNVVLPPLSNQWAIRGIVSSKRMLAKQARSRKNGGIPSNDRRLCQLALLVAMQRDSVSIRVISRDLPFTTYELR